MVEQTAQRLVEAELALRLGRTAVTSGTRGGLLTAELTGVGYPLG